MCPSTISSISNINSVVTSNEHLRPPTGCENNLPKKIRRIKNALKKSETNANGIITKILTKAKEEKLDPDLYIEKKPKQELNPEIEQLLQQLYTELDKQDKYQSQLLTPNLKRERLSELGMDPDSKRAKMPSSAPCQKPELSMTEIPVASDGLCFFRAILVDKTQCTDYASGQKINAQEIEGLVKDKFNTELEFALKSALSNLVSMNMRPSLMQSKSDDEIITLLKDNPAKWYSGTALAQLFSHSANDNDFEEFNVFSDVIFTHLSTQFDTSNLVYDGLNHYDVKIRRPIENAAL
ncbi:hypothetical protein [Vibrio aestuarianus]|uniref:OTU domain-containing protein n=1 Tax=Vibrio aestuarianus TaxID=28171 RepID=A0ABD7YQ75_9VIBR|nr:hypothetical protein [Vibrio aestuarianus]WGK86680.1 hypothetical protein PYE67_17155 [Vibrio aestuarianus]CAH8212184.1 hypothetical protein VAEU17_330139 [Vibrio aestuarianus]